MQDNLKIPVEAVPLYRQIHHEIRSLIVSGKILPGEIMPSENEVTRKYGVSRFTAQQVFRLLVDEGLVVRRRGQGTFVKDIDREAAKKSVSLTLGGLHSHDTSLGQAQQRFARRVAELSLGLVRVEVHHSSQLGSGSDQLRAVSEGDQDMFSAATDWLERLEPSWGVTNLPFLFQNIDHARRFVESQSAEFLRQKLLGKSNIRVLADNLLRPSRLILSRKPCFDIDDFKGLRIRIPPIPTYRILWETMGASPIELGWDQINEALRNHSIDAVDAPRDVMRQEGFHKHINYITHTRHLYSRACIVISEKRFQALRPDVQEILTRAARETGESYLAGALAKWEKDKVQMIAEGARFIHTDTEPFRQRTAPILESNRELRLLVEDILNLRSGPASSGQARSSAEQGVFDD